MSYKKAREEIEKKALSELEQDFSNVTVDNLSMVIEQKQQEIMDDIKAYIAKYKRPLIDPDTGLPKYDKQGYPLYENSIKGLDNFTIDRMFFKSVCGLSNKEPKYSAEKMGVVFELYKYIVDNVNINIGRLIPNKTHFCMFAGITQSTYNRYKMSTDSDMQIVIEKIDDYLSNAQFSMAQEGKIREKTTLERLNIEMDKKKNYNPQVVVKADVKDISSYEKRIKELENIDLGSDSYEVGVEE